VSPVAIRSQGAGERTARVRAHLDALREEYGFDFRDRDPVQFPHRYATKADREIAALLSALLAFGKVEVVLRNLRDLFERLGPRPASAIRGLDARSAGRCARGFRHRWIGESELGRLLVAAGRLLSDHEDLEAAFVAGDDPASPTIGRGLAAFTDRALAASGRPRDRAMKFLFPSPGRGGACKRLNLFLRWVARPADGLDLGLWSAVAPARLMIPLDTHVAFHARVLGFSRRKTADWRMVEEVTSALRAIDPADPVRYDFALCHLGMHGDCRKRRDPDVCHRCPIDTICRLPHGRRAR
jgi:uncharacterized protein (TIGR02757 family)